MFTRLIFSAKALFCLLGVLCLPLPSAQASETVLHSFSSNYLSGAYPIGQLAVYGTSFYGVTVHGINGYGDIYKMSTTGAITSLHEFNGADGVEPRSGMVLVSGNFYGTTFNGGSANQGVLYRIAPDGTGFTVLHSFTGGGDGTYVNAGLTPASDGKLYGVTLYGGVYDQGILFSFDPSTNTYAILHSFNNDTDGGEYPSMALAEGSDGSLYGIIQHETGNTYDYGTLYKINKDGTGYAIVHTFPTDGSDPAGANPACDLIRASDGNIYGTCEQGGLNNLGTVFKLAPSTGSVTPLWSFDGTTGAYPYFNQSRLLQGTDGNLYGVTSYGGSHGYGTAFKLTLGGACSVLTNFNYNNADGSANPLIQHGTSFYGTSFYGGRFATPGNASGYGAAFSITSTGTLKVLNSFYQLDGYSSEDRPVQIGTSFYGTTRYGGQYSQGILYKADAKGNYSILHHFQDDQSSLFEGANPIGGLLLARDGKLYGMTSTGGLYGYGTLFKVSTGGAYTVIHHFQAAEGTTPSSALVQGAGTDTTLYGTLSYGGNNNNGSLFATDTAGKSFSILHYFSGSDGSQPQCTPLPNGSGYFYGSCTDGGANGMGTLWVASATGFRLLHNFSGYASSNPPASDGAFPSGTLALVYVSATRTYLFGTAARGGAYDEGVLFADNVNVATDNTGVVHAFNDSLGEGVLPLGGILYDSASANFYGSCSGGGANSVGTVYNYNRTSGVLSVLYAFPQGGGEFPDPFFGPILGSDGYLYGTHPYTGSYGEGMLYRLTTTP